MSDVIITGLPELLKKFSGLQTNGDRYAKAVVQSTADKAVLTAKSLAPRDLGGIVQGISKEQLNNGFAASIHASAPESAYMEFGTGPQVDVPEDMADAASQFMGAGDGTFADFIIALTDWVGRHGGAQDSTQQYSVSTRKRIGSKNVAESEDTKAAWAIARAILARGLKPQPFLYPAYEDARTSLPIDLEKTYKTLLNDANTI